MVFFGGAKVNLSFIYCHYKPLNFYFFLPWMTSVFVFSKYYLSLRHDKDIQIGFGLINNLCF